TPATTVWSPGAESVSRARFFSATCCNRRSRCATTCTLRIVRSRPSAGPGKLLDLPNERSNRIGRNAQFQAKRPERALHLLLDGAVAVRDHEHPAFIRVFGGNVNDIRQSSGRRENPSATFDQL